MGMFFIMSTGVHSLLFFLFIFISLCSFIIICVGLILNYAFWYRVTCLHFWYRFVFVQGFVQVMQGLGIIHTSRRHVEETIFNRKKKVYLGQF